MRDREQIIKEFIAIPKTLNLLSSNRKEVGLQMNPKLQLEVLLDIRDQLVKLTEALQSEGR